jgi:hypothetical protein
MAILDWLLRRWLTVAAILTLQRGNERGWHMAGGRRLR